MSSSPRHDEDQHSRFELRTLIETSRLLIESHDMNFVINNLLLITMGKLMVSRAIVIIHHPETGKYTVSKAKGRNVPDEGTVVELNWNEEAQKKGVIRPHRDGFEIPEILESETEYTFFNLYTSNYHLGFLCLGMKGNKQPLSPHEIEFVESLSIISSVAIANSRMFAELKRINRMLDRKVYELNTLFDLSKDFNIMVDRDQIVRVFKFAMLGQMLIRKFFFVLENDGKREMVTASGIGNRLKKNELTLLFDEDKDLIEVDDRLRQEIPFLKENEIVAVIGLRFQSQKIGLVGIGARANKEEYTQSDYTFLQSLGNLALLSIQKTYLLEERIEKERLEEELNIAKAIQKGLLPDPIPHSEQLDIAAVNISSRQVGGDYYDILETPDKKLLFAIGDVTGKGTPAALLMANLQAMLHVLLPVDITLAEATNRLNDIIYSNTPSDKFITFFWGLYYPNSSMFKYVNAGHNPPIWLKKGSDESLELSEGGLILGAMPTLNPYEEHDIEFDSGDLLVFYTDGVTEAMNPEATEEYEEERLIKCILKNRDLSAQELLTTITDDVNAFTGDNQSDDITLVVIKVQ